MHRIDAKAVCGRSSTSQAFVLGVLRRREDMRDQAWRRISERRKISLKGLLEQCELPNSDVT